MTDEEKIAHLEDALQRPEGKYTHQQIRDRLTSLREGSAGPSARRAASGMAPGPRTLTDEEAGVATGPQIGTLNRGAGEETPGYTKQRTTTELEGDPSMQAMAAGAMGAAAAAPAAWLTGLVAPSVAPVVGGAVANGVAAHAQGADLPTSGRAAVIGALMGLPAGTSRLIRQAPAATDARLQASIDPGRGASARRVAGALPGAKPVIDETPGLKRTLITSQDPGEKALALSDAISPDVAANDAAMDRLGAFHGGDSLPVDRPYGPFPGRRMVVPIRTPRASLGDLGQEARRAGNFKLEDAATRMSEDLNRGGVVSGRQVGIPVETLRGMRNLAAEHVEGMSPSTGNPKLASLNERNADAIRGALSDSFERLAVPGSGVDPAAMTARNQRIASVLPLQRSLEAQDVASRLGPEDGISIPHTKWQAARKVLGAVDRGPALTDLRLSEPAFQRIGGALPTGAGPEVPVVGAADPLTRVIRGRRKKNQEQTNAD